MTEPVKGIIYLPGGGLVAARMDEHRRIYYHHVEVMFRVAREFSDRTTVPFMPLNSPGATMIPDCEKIWQELWEGGVGSLPDLDSASAVIGGTHC